MYNCSKVRDDLQVLDSASCPCHQSCLLSCSVFFLDSYSQVSTSCCCPPNNGRASLWCISVVCINLCFRSSVKQRGCVDSRADAVPRLSLCTDNPKDSNMLCLSLCMHSPMCRAGMVQPDGTRRIVTVIIQQLFSDSSPMQFVGSLNTVPQAV